MESETMSGDKMRLLSGRQSGKGNKVTYTHGLATRRKVKANKMISCRFLCTTHVKMSPVLNRVFVLFISTSRSSVLKSVPRRSSMIRSNSMKVVSQLAQLVKCVCVLALVIHLASSESDACKQHTTCGACIQTPKCVWCSQPVNDSI